MPPGLQLLVLLLCLVVFWLLIMRPARNAQRRQVELQQAVSVGDRVIIAAGIFGNVASVEDDRIGLEIAPGTVITVARQAVVRRLDETNPSDADKTEE